MKWGVNYVTHKMIPLWLIQSTYSPPKPMTMGPMYERLFKWYPLDMFLINAVELPFSTCPVDRGTA